MNLYLVDENSWPLSSSVDLSIFFFISFFTFFVFFPLFFSISVRLFIAWVIDNVNQCQGCADHLSLHLSDRHPLREWNPKIQANCAEAIGHIPLN